FTSAIACAPAVLASLAATEFEVGAFHDGNPGLFDQIPGWQVGMTTLRADYADQPLCQYSGERGDEAVSIDPHVEEAADHVEHVVGVNRGKNQMSCQRGLNCNLRGLGVSDLAHHDLVRIMAQDGAQTAREGEAFLLVDGYLQHAGEL